jgi:SAM-dependent methyltransferase
MNTVKTIDEDETTRFLQSATPAERRAAWFYEEKFVPGLFAPWSARTIAAAGIAAGDRVLDIACGTGVVTRDVAAVTGPESLPTGLDLSPGMLAVAHSLDTRIDWRLGDAGQLPFADGSFDRVVCQFGLMFFPDRVRALAEMRRVLRPEGRLALAVWAGLERNPGYAEKVQVLEHIAGSAAADALRAPFCLGDRNRLLDFAHAAGIGDLRIETHVGEACFGDLFEFVDVDLRGWLPVMGVQLDEPTIRRVHAACAPALDRYVDSRSGRITLPASAHILCGSRCRGNR